jgi:hypothetical protein
MNLLSRDSKLSLLGRTPTYNSSSRMLRRKRVSNRLWSKRTLSKFHKSQMNSSYQRIPHTLMKNRSTHPAAPQAPQLCQGSQHFPMGMRIKDWTLLVTAVRCLGSLVNSRTPLMRTRPPSRPQMAQFAPLRSKQHPRSQPNKCTARDSQGKTLC